MSVTTAIGTSIPSSRPVELLCRLDRCPDPDCPGHHKTRSPETEVTIALPRWAIGWDVLWDWSSPLFAPHGDPLDPIRTPGRLRDRSSPTLIHQYIPMVPGHARGAAARPQSLRRHYAATAEDHPLRSHGLDRVGAHQTLERRR